MLAWDSSGSIAAEDWLPYAVVASFVLAAVLLAGTAVLPGRTALIAAALLVSFSVWTAVSAAWSPLPDLARDDGLLALFYAVAFLTPLVTLRSAADRLAALVVVVLGLGALAVATAVSLRGGSSDLHYLGGRLDFPVTYWNGEAAMTLVAFWPAVALSAERSLNPILRGLTLAAATSMLALWVGTQSKGGGVALAASAVVFFSVSGARLRTLVPTALAAALAGAGARALTEPFRADAAGFDRAVHRAGTVTLGLAAIAAVVGCVYAVVDGRVRVPARAARIAGIVVVAVMALALIGGAGVFVSKVDHPIGWTQGRWDDFKHLDTSEQSSSHFGQLGSNRYDFWRVALDEFRDHPVAGIGGHGWAVAYLRHGQSRETPQRGHSLELDALSETGILGALLLVAAGVLALVAVGLPARRSLPAAGALGTAAYFVVHTGGDWVWTIPAVSLPAFAIVGIGASIDRNRPLPWRFAVPAGVVAIVMGLVAFAPPWLSSRLVDRAYEARTPVAASGDLRWARRLDRLAVEPLIAQSALAKPPATIPPLVKAVAKQPRDPELYYLLGLAYIDAGRKADARRVLRAALAFSPRDDAIRLALREAG
jgi:O-Antigen ligase/Tetratricopeptide repeat